MALFPQAGFEPLLTPPGLTDTFTTTVPVNCACFEGHFDGAPILPGIAQLALVLEACAVRAGRRCVISGVRDLRWQRPVLPGDELTITLSDVLLPGVLRFSITCRNEMVSTGTLGVADGGTLA